MPTKPKQHRTYCKTCEDFTIHNWKDKETLTCDKCDSVNDGYIVSEVKPELIQQQRLRYKEQNRRKITNMLSYVTSMGNGIGVQADNIIECDAGQKQIDEAEQEKRKLEREKLLQEIQFYQDNFKLLGRNDKCSCGSGKKYKQCHLIYYRDKGIV